MLLNYSFFHGAIGENLPQYTSVLYKSVTHIGPPVRMVFHILQIRDTNRVSTVGLISCTQSQPDNFVLKGNTVYTLWAQNWKIAFALVMMPSALLKVFLFLCRQSSRSQPRPVLAGLRWPSTWDGAAGRRPAGLHQGIEVKGWSNGVLHPPRLRPAVGLPLGIHEPNRS